MTWRFKIDADVSPSREVRVSLPKEVPLGPAEIVLALTPKNDHQGCTMGDLADSEFFGMWADRMDIEESSQFAQQLRDQAWNRNK